MIQLNSDLIELLAAFEKFGVRYLIIGGQAFGLHVEPRYTKDVDFGVSTSKKNAAAVHRALVHFGAPSRGGGPELFEQEDTFFWFGFPPNRIDILMGPPGGLSFDSAWRRRISTKIGGQITHFVGREDLIAIKRAAGRAIDRRDVRALLKSDPDKDGALVEPGTTRKKKPRSSAPRKGS